MTPFVQGRLRGEGMSASVRSECAACHLPLVFTIDSQFRWRMDEGTPSPLVFQPSIDWTTFTQPNIINDY